MSKDDDHHEGVLAEDLRDQFRLILEALTALKDVPADVKQIKRDMAEMKDWRGAVKMVIKDQSKTLNKHEIRLDNLEAA